MMGHLCVIKAKFTVDAEMHPWALERRYINKTYYYYYYYYLYYYYDPRHCSETQRAYVYFTKSHWAILQFRFYFDKSLSPNMNLCSVGPSRLWIMNWQAFVWFTVRRPGVFVNSVCVCVCRFCVSPLCVCVCVCRLCVSSLCVCDNWQPCDSNHDMLIISHHASLQAKPRLPDACYRLLLWSDDYYFTSFSCFRSLFTFEYIKIRSHLNIKMSNKYVVFSKRMTPCKCFKTLKIHKLLINYYFYLIFSDVLHFF